MNFAIFFIASSLIICGRPEAFVVRQRYERTGDGGVCQALHAGLPFGSGRAPLARRVFACEKRAMRFKRETHARQNCSMRRTMRRTMP